MSDAGPPVEIDPAPCPKCGRSRADNLTVDELYDQFGYLVLTCMRCFVSHVPRRKVEKVTG